jgi:hypothetical protein
MTQVSFHLHTCNCFTKYAASFGRIKDPELQLLHNTMYYIDEISTAMEKFMVCVCVCVCARARAHACALKRSKKVMLLEATTFWMDGWIDDWLIDWLIDWWMDGWVGR